MANQACGEARQGEEKIECLCAGGAAVKAGLGVAIQNHAGQGASGSGCLQLFTRVVQRAALPGYIIQGVLGETCYSF